MRVSWNVPLIQKRGWSRRHSAALIAQAVPLEADFKQSSSDDAGPLQFGALNGDQFVRLKTEILRLLE